MVLISVAKVGACVSDVEFIANRVRLHRGPGCYASRYRTNRSKTNFPESNFTINCIYNATRFFIHFFFLMPALFPKL